MELSCFCRRGVVGSSPQHPDTVLEDYVAADHAAGRPGRLLGTNPGPANTVGRVPAVSVKPFLVVRGFREGGHGLSAQDPDLAVQYEGVVQCPWSPGHIPALVDMNPAAAVGRVPDVVLVVTLVHVAADDPHLVPEDHVSGRMTTFPVSGRVEFPVEKRVGLVQFPVQAVL